MAKKFSDSPALAFINTPEEQAETATKSTKDKPEKLRTITIPEGMTINPELFVEKRSRRVQLVLRPSVYDKAKARADRLGISFNEYVAALLEADSAE